MNLWRLAAASVLGTAILASNAIAEEKDPKDAPKEQKSNLPAGHPQPGGGLPAGHPGTGGGGGLPAGHPGVGGGNNGGLPAGHPGVGGGGSGGDLNHPQLRLAQGQKLEAGTAAPGEGATIRIKAVQGTRGAAAVSGDTAMVEFFDIDGKIAGSASGKLSDKGEATIERIPLTIAFQPLVTVFHNGVAFKAAGAVMNKRAAEQNVEVRVFDTTDQEPAWEVQMRHVIVNPTRNGLAVMEMLSIANPTDRAWTGKKDPSGKAFTMMLPLPAGAQNVQVISPQTAGSQEPGFAVVNGAAAYAKPILPGGEELQVKYTLPASNGSAAVSLVAPALTRSIFVFLPEDGTTVETTDLKKVESKPGMKLKANARFYTAAAQKPGDRLNFTVSNLQSLKEPAVAAQ